MLQSKVWKKHGHEQNEQYSKNNTETTKKTLEDFEVLSHKLCVVY